MLRLLSRVAFICNICFLLASFVQWLPVRIEGMVISYVILLGYLLSGLVNVVVNCWVLILLLTRRLRAAAVPAWLLITNFIFFILLLVLLLMNRQ